MFAILLLILVFGVSDVEARQLSQLEEIPHQIQPMALRPHKPLRPLAEYPVLKMENISWHTSSPRRVTYTQPQEPIPQEGLDIGVRPSARTHQLAVSAYTSRPEETDSTPFETASGKRVQWGIVASNKFPLGTKLRFPKLFGEQEFVVEDCMNERYKQRVDIWMPELKPARKFGLKKGVEVEVVEYGQRRMCYS
ncbi:MAG: hypothetical protein AAB367_02160 [Patescibacteria group bacterium]